MTIPRRYIERILRAYDRDGRQAATRSAQRAITRGRIRAIRPCRRPGATTSRSTFPTDKLAERRSPAFRLQLITIYIVLIEAGCNRSYKVAAHSLVDLAAIVSDRQERLTVIWSCRSAPRGRAPYSGSHSPCSHLLMF